MLAKYQERIVRVAALNVHRANLICLLDQIPFKHAPNAPLERLENAKANVDHKLSELLTTSLKIKSLKLGSKLVAFMFKRKNFTQAISKIERNRKQKQAEIYISCILICLCIPDGITIIQMRKALGVKSLINELNFLEENGFITRSSSKKERFRKIFASKRILPNLED